MRLSVTVMPHADAASRKQQEHQMTLIKNTGCRIGVRHDGYREPHLKNRKSILEKQKYCKPHVGLQYFRFQSPLTGASSLNQRHRVCTHSFLASGKAEALGCGGLD